MSTSCFTRAPDCDQLEMQIQFNTEGDILYLTHLTLTKEQNVFHIKCFRKVSHELFSTIKVACWIKSNT